MGAIPYKKAVGRPSVRPSDEDLAKLYSQYTAAEIAEQLGVKPSTVRSWIARQRRAAKAVANE
jgi:uncharacterized protein YjcR